MTRFWITLASLGLALSLFAQTGAQNGEWRTWGGDLGNTHYSPLAQITPANFGQLQVAWRFKTDNLGPTREANLESTPLMVGGILYSTAGSRRTVIALDATTGELLWTYKENEGKRGENAPRQLSGRGLSYWTDGRESRIVYVTPGYRMIALDAKTGAKVTSFGQNGVVDLKTENDQQIDLETGEVGLHSAPAIANDVIVVGAAHRPGGSPRVKANVKGYIRGYDARTGKRLWIFHTIPLPNEFGANTWEKDSAQYTGNAGAWGQISIDPDLNMAFIPVELPTGDYYGGHRPGNNLFGESILAVDLKTGQRKWHYQLVHHGIWDHDIPCAPMLVDITINGQTVKAVAQPTKQAFLYVFNRITGQPIWPIEERPVEKGTVPGEWYAPTQPFPTKPPAYDLHGAVQDDLINFTPELRAEALKIAANYKMGPIFTPPVESKPGGPYGLLSMATASGGTNWPGGSYDPETHVLYAPSQRILGSIGLIPGDPSRTEFQMMSGTVAPPNQRALTVQGLPMVKPPYGSITAIDMNRGETLWTIAHGESPDLVRNHPALKGLNVPRTGRPGTLGVLVTKTMLISGEKGTITMPNGQQGAYLRAYDKATGQEIGNGIAMPAGQTGVPMTYMVNNRQFLVIAIASGPYGAEFIAYALPQAGRPAGGRGGAAQQEQ